MIGNSLMMQRNEEEYVLNVDNMDNINNRKQNNVTNINFNENINQ